MFKRQLAKTWLSEKNISLITERMITLQLRALKKDGLIKRAVFAEVSPLVEYELIDMTLEFHPFSEYQVTEAVNIGILQRLNKLSFSMIIT